MRFRLLSLALVVFSGLCSAIVAAPATETSAVPLRDQKPRVWTDDSGRFQVTATLVEVRGNAVRLRREDGQNMRPSISRLSATDRRYLAALGRPEELPAPKPTPIAAQAATPERAQPNPAATGAAAPQNLQPVSIPNMTNLPLGNLDTDDAEEPVRLMYVVVSRKFFDSLIPSQVDETRRVSNVIVGTQFSGNSRTIGRSRLEFVPNLSQATFALRFNGTSVSDSIGGDRVQIYSRAYTWLDASKRILLDETGFHSQPAQSAARSVTQTLGLSTGLPGLRGNLALRIAGRRIESTRPQADAESAWHAQVRTNGEIDRKFASPLASWNAICRELLAAAKDGEYQLGARASTTSNELRLVIHRKTPGGRVPAEPLPAPINGGPQIAVWIHSSLIKRVMSNSNLQQALQPLLTRLAAQSNLAGRDNSGPFNYRVNWSDGGKWMTVSLSLPTSEGENRMAATQR